MKTCTLSIVLSSTLLLAAQGAQAERPPAAGHAPQTVAALSPKARADLTRSFVRRWGMHVERVYDVRVGIWASRMVSTFVHADAENFRNALKRATFEGAMAELGGQGLRMSDQRAAQLLARASLAAPADLRVKVLGSLEGDLTYTPMQPCRIIDTRNTVQGPIAAGGTRAFLAIAGTYAAQGGSATDCGTTGVVPSAVALNVTAVRPDRGGYATVYPSGTTAPTTSSLNYTASAIVNNAIITKVPNPLASTDFDIFSFGQSHYVVDIVGYFAPNKATALECTTVTSSQVVDNNVGFLFTSAACPTGYTMTGHGCMSNTFEGVAWGNMALEQNANMPNCAGTNRSGSTVTIRSNTRCCRVPGR